MKIGLLAGIFALSLVGGLAPLAIKNIVKVDGLLALVNCFSGGVFLCAGLTHILPHVVEHGASVKGYGEYPLPYVLVMLGYMLVFPSASCSTSTSTRRSTTRTRAVTATATATATVVPDTAKRLEAQAVGRRREFERGRACGSPTATRSTSASPFWWPSRCTPCSPA